MKKRAFIAITIVFAGACAFLFNSFSMEAKNKAITKLNEEQMVHAKQAAETRIAPKLAQHERGSDGALLDPDPAFRSE